MNFISTEKQFSRMCETVGLKIDGPRPIDPQITNPKLFYQAFARNPYLAMGESYVAGHYTVEDLYGMVMNFYNNDATAELAKLLTIRQKTALLFYHVHRKVINANARYCFSDIRGQAKIAAEHYDFDNDLMLATLGSSQKYTSGYWKPTYGQFELDVAQKLDLEIMARRIGLKPGMKVLDLGFGYGSNTKYLVERFGIEVTGLTISTEQLKHAKSVCKSISDNVRFILTDWRNISKDDIGLFDRVICLEMIESIGGSKNYDFFFRFISDVLNEDGSVFIQAINVNTSKIETNQWIEKYIFPNGVLPTPQSMQSASIKANLHLRLIDNSLGWANGQTCLAWWKNFSEAWPDLSKKIDVISGMNKVEKYKNHFKDISPYPVGVNTLWRIWQFYLVGSAAAQIAGYVNDGHFIWEKNPINLSQADVSVPGTREEVDKFLNEV